MQESQDVVEHPFANGGALAWMGYDVVARPHRDVVASFPLVQQHLAVDGWDQVEAEARPPARRQSRSFPGIVARVVRVRPSHQPAAIFVLCVAQAEP